MIKKAHARAKRLHRALPSLVHTHKTRQSGINFKPVGFAQGVEVVLTGSVAIEMHKTWRLEVYICAVPKAFGNLHILKAEKF